MSTTTERLSITFASLSSLAFVLLWLVMGVNGTLEMLLSTAWRGVFPDGTSMRMSYSGIPFLDFPLRILIAFFFGLANLRQLAPYLMLVDLVAALFVINMMTLVESYRPTVPKGLRS